MTVLTWGRAKDPDEILDYTLDWAAHLGADAIASSVWSVASGGAGLVLGSTSYSSTATIIWLSAGTVATNYELLNRITTTGGRTMDQTVRLKIKTR